MQRPSGWRLSTQGGGLAVAPSAARAVFAMAVATVAGIAEVQYHRGSGPEAIRAAAERPGRIALRD